MKSIGVVQRVDADSFVVVDIDTGARAEGLICELPGDEPKAGDRVMYALRRRNDRLLAQHVRRLTS